MLSTQFCHSTILTEKAISTICEPLLLKRRRPILIVRHPERYADDELLRQLPQGFEFCEHLFDAQIVLRKVLKSKITEDEINIAEQVMQQHGTVKDYLLNRDKESISVYQTEHTEAETFYDKELLRQIKQYDAKLRFRQTEEETYQAQRSCR
ncbi:MAG: hypothetical protein AAF223_15315, partial [Bacteroidota bacterium]